MFHSGANFFPIKLQISKEQQIFFLINKMFLLSKLLEIKKENMTYTFEINYKYCVSGILRERVGAGIDWLAKGEWHRYNHF